MSKNVQKIFSKEGTIYKTSLLMIQIGKITCIVSTEKLKRFKVKIILSQSDH